MDGKMKKFEIIKLFIQIAHLALLITLNVLMGWQIALTIYFLMLALMILGFISYMEDH